MKKIVLVLILLVAIFFPSASFAGDWQGNLNFIGGSRGLNNNWQPVESQPALDIRVDFGAKDWIANIVIGISASAKTAACTNTWDCRGSLAEFYVGGQKYFSVTDAFNPYIGLGISSVSAKAEFASYYNKVEYIENTTGFFIQGGAMWRLGALNLGLDLRILTGAKFSKDLKGLEDANYAQAGFLIGYNW